MDCSPPSFFVHGISQARILEWVALSFSRTCSRPRIWTCISYVPALAGGFFTTEQQGSPQEHPLEKEIAIHLIFLAWEIPGTEEPWDWGATVHGVVKSQTWLNSWAHTQSSGEEMTHWPAILITGNMKSFHLTILKRFVSWNKRCQSINAGNSRSLIFVIKVDPSLYVIEMRC